MTLQERIEEMLRLEAEATPGDWFLVRTTNTLWEGKTEDVWDVQHEDGDHTQHIAEFGAVKHPICKANASLAIAARNIVKPMAHALEASLADRQTLKSRLDGVYGALADAATVIVSADNPGESVRALVEERDKLEARNRELEAALAKERSDG